MKKNPATGIFLFLCGIIFLGLECSYPEVAPPRPREYAYRRPVRVVYGKAVIVRINDRGPFVAGRILDLSYGAAQKIEGTLHGVMDVKIEILEWGKE